MERVHVNRHDSLHYDSVFQDYLHQSLPQRHAERTAERDCSPETEDQEVSDGDEEQRYGQEDRQKENVKH